MLGANELAWQVDITEIIADYEVLLSIIANELPITEVIVQSALPMRDLYASRNPAIDDFNVLLADLAADFGYEYLNVHDVMELNGELNPDYARDGIHLVAAGYEVWLEILEGKGE